MRWFKQVVLLVAVAVLFSVTTTLADPLGADTVAVENSSRFNDTTEPDSVEAQAGNVTELSITTTTVTRTWQGFFGNITGTLILADSSGNNFYDWDVSTPSGQVYASRNDSVVWADIDCMDATRIDEENDFLGRTSADPDSVTNTFSATNHPWFFVGTTNVSECPTTQAYSSGGIQSAQFWQVLLNDQSNNTVYTTIIEDTTPAGFDNNPWHFQLLVGENGHPGNEGTTTYYFYVELN